MKVKLKLAFVHVQNQTLSHPEVKLKPCVPEVRRASIQLHFSCHDCHGPRPNGVDVWEMKCPRPGGVVVGVAASVTLIDLDYLMCAYLTNLGIDYTGGCVHSDGNSCNSLGPFVMTSVWANNQDFRSPSSFAYQGRLITSGEKLDMGRCMTPKEDVGSVVGVSGNHFHRLLCPPHMVGVTLAWLDPTSAPLLNCCLVY
ncbi:uncharacterized protein [Panulirus ornatus]|uniref:uncharacterized protein n=1 Tax=Panulirus ornatus TaxID=150431 RepID=UPI003A850045